MRRIVQEAFKQLSNVYNKSFRESFIPYLSRICIYCQTCSTDLLYSLRQFGEKVEQEKYALSKIILIFWAEFSLIKVKIYTIVPERNKGQFSCSGYYIHCSHFCLIHYSALRSTLSNIYITKQCLALCILLLTLRMIVSLLSYSIDFLSALIT